MPLLKQKMLNWLKPFNIFCFFDNCSYNIAPHNFECLVAAGSKKYISSQTSSFNKINDLVKEKKWLFGHLSFELKNDFFHFTSDKKDEVDFPLFYFFEPQVVITLKGNKLSIYADDADNIYNEIVNSQDEHKHQRDLVIENKLTK